MDLLRLTTRGLVCKRGQVRAIWQAPDELRLDVRRQAGQNVSAVVHSHLDHVKIMKVGVPHDQHTRSDRAQHAEAADPFAGMVGPETSIHDSVCAAFGQVHGLHLREGTVAAMGDRRSWE